MKHKQPFRSTSLWTVGALAAAAALVAGLGLGGAGLGSAPTGQWRGSYRLPRAADAVQIAIRLDRRRVVVALPGGYSGVQSVPLERRGNHVRFRLPGRPSHVVFDGTLKGRSITGTVAQGAVHGTVTLARSTTSPLPGSAPGVYRFSSGRTVGVVDLGQLRLFDLANGDVRGLFGSGTGRYRVGSSFGLATPTEGDVRFSPDGSTLDWSSERASRVLFRQAEVRFPAGGASLAGTLTLPNGEAPYPAVAVVHGSGPTSREGSQIFAEWFAAHGIAVLAYDKRGIGQSGGIFPGEAATNTAIERLARDAEAAVRFLAAQPELDARHIGLWGSSQAGWIIPLAASRSPAAFGVIGVGPTVSVGEEGFYSNLTNDGDGAGLSAAQAEARLGETTPSGFDPVPAIRSLRIPVLWLYGAEDRSIPSRRSATINERLRSETGADFTTIVFPRAGHSLLETPSGLNSEIAGARRFAPGLFAELIEWLRARLGALP